MLRPEGTIVKTLAIGGHYFWAAFAIGLWSANVLRVLIRQGQEEIRALETARNEAIVHGDAAALERMTSDDYTFITLRGELRTQG